jgi:hypothetical protein
MNFMGINSNGIWGRIRAQNAAWKLARSQREEAERALERARQLDADEVGQRADRRHSEREAAVDAQGPGDVSE